MTEKDEQEKKDKIKQEKIDESKKKDKNERKITYEEMEKLPQFSFDKYYEF